MGGDDLSVEMALAKSLDDALDLDTSRAWGTIAEVSDGAVAGHSGVDFSTPEPAIVADYEPDFEVEDELEELVSLADDLPGFGPSEEDDMLDFLDSLAELDDGDFDLEDV